MRKRKGTGLYLLYVGEVDDGEGEERREGGNVEKKKERRGIVADGRRREMKKGSGSSYECIYTSFFLWDENERLGGPGII